MTDKKQKKITKKKLPSMYEGRPCTWKALKEKFGVDLDTKFIMTNPITEEQRGKIFKVQNPCDEDDFACFSGGEHENMCFSFDRFSI